MLASCRFPYSTTFPPVAVSGTGRSDMAEPLHLPPLTLTADGAQRRVGVEIEFAELESREAAQLVQDLYGGRSRNSTRSSSRCATRASAHSSPSSTSAPPTARPAAAEPRPREDRKSTRRNSSH